MFDTSVQDKVQHGIDAITKYILDKSIYLAESIELFLEPNPDEESCRYYFVDHIFRTQFWLEAVNTEELGVWPSLSGNHLRAWPFILHSP